MFITIWSKGPFKWYIIYLSTRLESTLPISKTAVTYNAGVRLAARTRCIRIHAEHSYESIRKYPRKLGSLRKAESVANRGAEEKTELGLIYGYKFSSGRGSGNTIQAQFSSSLTPVLRVSVCFAPPLPPPSPPLTRPLPLVTTGRSRETLDARVKTYEHICTASITRADETWHGCYGGAMKMRWQNGGSSIPGKVVRGLMSRVKLDVRRREKAMFSGRCSSTLIVCQGAISRENAR